jgi:uncharacterized membrane protein (UPF0136 family)
MNPVVGQVALGVYAVLLAVGGIMGYVKAGSKPSLVAGVVSAVLALSCLVVMNTNQALGLGLGAVLAALMLVVFGARFAKSRKFMPGGLLTAMSLFVLVLVVAAAIGAKG